MGVGQELILVVLQIIREGEMICLNHYICVEFCQIDKSKPRVEQEQKNLCTLSQYYTCHVLQFKKANEKSDMPIQINDDKCFMLLYLLTKSYNIAALMLLVQSAGPVQIFTSTKDITCTPYL